MIKYRIKQVGEKFFIEHKELLGWWKFESYSSIYERHGFPSLELAKARIDELTGNQKIIIHEYP